MELPKHMFIKVCMVTHGYSWFLMVSNGYSWFQAVWIIAATILNKKKRPLGGIGCHKCDKGNVHCRTITVKVCEKLNKNCHQGALVMEVLQNTNINWRTINGNIVLKFQLDSTCCLWTIAAWITKKGHQGELGKAIIMEKETYTVVLLG